MRIAKPIYDVVFKYLMDDEKVARLLIRDPFVEALTHDALVVQINRLKNRRRAEQEVRERMDVEDDMLTAFQDQARAVSDMRQTLAEKDQALADMFCACPATHRKRRSSASARRG